MGKSPVYPRLKLGPMTYILRYGESVGAKPRLKARIESRILHRQRKGKEYSQAQSKCNRMPPLGDMHPIMQRILGHMQ